MLKLDFVYRRYLCISAVLHVFLIIMLCFSFRVSTLSSAAPVTDVIHATVVSPQVLSRSPSQKTAKVVASKKKITVKKQEAKKKALKLAKEKRQAWLEKKQAAEKAKKQKLAREKAKKIKLAKLKKAQEAKERLAKQQAEEKRKAAEAAQIAAAKQAAQMQASINKYTGLIVQAISEKWLVPSSATKDMACELLIQLAPSGEVMDVQLVKSSDNPALDRSAIAAVYQASPLPVPKDKKAFNPFRQFSLTVTPRDLVS